MGCCLCAGKEEAQLAFKGATGSLCGSARCGSYTPAGICNSGSSSSCLVIDLGGRSTEFAAGRFKAELKLDSVSLVCLVPAGLAPTVHQLAAR